MWSHVARMSMPVQTRSDRTIFTDPETGASFVPGETSTNRTIYNAIALFCLILLSTLLGFRAKTLFNNVFRKRNFTSMLVVALFVFGLGFIICASVVQTGQGLRTHHLCYSSAMICLVFYTGSKLTIYIFLLERARVVRAPFMSRHKDWVWLVGMFIMLGGFGSIAIVGYLTPVVELSKLDGLCRIGLPPKVSFPLLCFDVLVNVLLTGVFFWLLRPVIKFHGFLHSRNCCGGTFGRKIKPKTGNQVTLRSQGRDGLERAMNKNIKTLLWKCLVGSVLVMLPTVGNMAQFYAMKSRELGWVCLTICTLDVSWGVIVINWLTIGSAKAESNLTTLMSQRTLCNDSFHQFAPILIRRGRSDINLSTNAFGIHAPHHYAPKTKSPGLCETIDLRDEGGLLKDDMVSNVLDVEQGIEVQRPEKSCEAFTR